MSQREVNTIRDRRIVKAYLGGMSQEDIGEWLSLTRARVQQILAANGVRAHGTINRSRKFSAPGALAKRFDWSAIRSLSTQGLCDAEIARRLGCQSTVVLNARRRMKLRAGTAGRLTAAILDDSALLDIRVTMAARPRDTYRRDRGWYERSGATAKHLAAKYGVSQITILAVGSGTHPNYGPNPFLNGHHRHEAAR